MHTQKSECVAICVCGCVYASISTYIPTRNFQIAYMNRLILAFRTISLITCICLTSIYSTIQHWIWTLSSGRSLLLFSYFMILSPYLLLALETFLISSLTGGVRRRHKLLLHVRSGMDVCAHASAEHFPERMCIAHPVPIALSSIHSPCIIRTHKSSVSYDSLHYSYHNPGAMIFRGMLVQWPPCLGLQ